MKWLYSDNPTPRQRVNRIIAQRKWREIKKKLKVDGEITIPFGIGLLAIGLISLCLLLSV